MKSNANKLALFGHPVKHSLSPQIHDQFAQQFDLSIDYQLIDVSVEGFESAVKDFFKLGGRGANVTLPHKLLALATVDATSNRAKLAQAVNTLSLNNFGDLVGDNTDGYGFIQDLKNRCHFDCKYKKILILGAGGATKGIVPAIMSQQLEQVVIANRSLDKAQIIAHYDNSQAVSFEQLASIKTKFDLIIHSSSLGHQGKTLKFFSHQFHQATICYDLSYALAAQPFLNFSKKMGINHIYDGLGMLIEQAAKSFEIWFDLIPDCSQVNLN